MLILCRTHGPLTWAIFVFYLLSSVTSTLIDDDDTHKLISNCFIRDTNNIRCTGDFNVSDILIWAGRDFNGLELYNLDIEKINESTLQFYGFKFKTIRIENAPRLRYIHPDALAELKDHLTHFRAINTSLPQYNDFRNGPHPFKDFLELREVYIGEQSHCPSDETLLYPCECKIDELSRQIPTRTTGIWASSAARFSFVKVFGTTHLTCNNKNLTGDDLKKIFARVSRSDHLPKHFDVLSLVETSSLTEIPSDVFSKVSITTIWMEDINNLKLIHPNAFSDEASDHVAKSIQVIGITNANFTEASSSEVDDIFQAFSSLTNLRILRLISCGIPHIPPLALTPKNPDKQLNNLRYITLSFDQKRHIGRGITFVGSYAFSGAPYLVDLRLTDNNIEQIDSFAFAFNQTSSTRLTIHISENPLNDSYGLKPNAFSGSQRPVEIKFERRVHHGLGFHFMPEDVFRPFIEENPANYIELRYYNGDIWCDCKSQWMFEQSGKLKSSVQNAIRIRKAPTSYRYKYITVQCKSDSSFECLPNCLAFPLSELIHCVGNKEYDVKSTFEQLALSNITNRLEKLVFSSKKIRELPMDAFGSFQFEKIYLADCCSLSYIHPSAFGASTGILRTFSAKNTNLTYYPNFGNFPNLNTIHLDSFNPFYINSSNFDYTQIDNSSNDDCNELDTTDVRKIHIYLNNGTIDPETFTKLINETVTKLIIIDERDERNESLDSKLVKLKLEEETFTNFFKANPKNVIEMDGYLECSCELEWIYENWSNEMKVGPRFTTSWCRDNLLTRFFCVPQGYISTAYFSENCYV